VKNFFARRFELGDSAGRIIPMEGMRGFAALLVFFVHFQALFNPYFQNGSFFQQFAEYAGRIGHTGVDVFFVISGFLMYGIVLRGRSTFGAYFMNRVRRLYPVFLVSLAIYLILSFVFPNVSKIPGSFRPALLYVAANLMMLPGMTPIVPIMNVAWSLSYEWFFYLSLPALVWILRLRRWRSWRRIAFFVLLAAVQFYFRTIGGIDHARLVMFVSGIVLWELVKNHGLALRLKSWGEYVVIAAFVLNLAWVGTRHLNTGAGALVMLRVPSPYVPSLFVTVFGLCAYTFLFNGLLARLFSWDYLRWAGNMSYSYYLIHPLALHGTRVLVNAMVPPAPRSAFFDVVLLLICLITTLTLAAVMFLLIEKPISLRRPGTVSEPSASAVVQGA
jgi:peptidoglycan/LPS O-acetylase OafA/YrhL